MSGLTGLMLIAGVGLLNNGSLKVSNDLSDVVNKFNNDNVSGSVQRVLATASPEIIDVLKTAPPCLTGFLPAGVGSPAGVIETNVPQSILNQGKSLFTPPALPTGSMLVRSGILDSSVAAFTNAYSQASAYAATTFGFQGSIAEATGKKFDDLGFQFKNYSDVLSGGVTNQFNAEAVPAMAEQMQKFGTMFNTKDLAQISSPAALILNLYDQGLGDVGGLKSMVDERYIDLENYDEADKDLLINILKEITGSDLDEITLTTEFNPAYPENIKTLADVLDINNLFAPEAIAAVGPGASLDTLSNKLSNVGGSFGSFTTIGNFLGGLTLTSFPMLNSLGTLLPDSLTSGLSSILGKGSGPFGNPTTAELTGSASGFGYTDNLKSIVDTQANLLQSDETVYRFKDYLDTEPNLDPAQLQSLIDDINGNPGLTNTLGDANQKMISCTERLATEKNNLQLAGISPGLAQSSTSSLLNFSGQLHGMGVDPMQLNLGSMLSNMTTNDIHGEAIQASLIEGKNLGRLSVFGINPGTKMDPMAYAQSLRAMA